MEKSMENMMEFWKEEVLPVLPKANITIDQLQQIIKYVLTNSEIRTSILKVIADQRALELALESASDQDMEIDLHYSDESGSSKASEAGEATKKKKKRKKITTPKKDKRLEVKMPVKQEAEDDVIVLDDSDDEPLLKLHTAKSKSQLKSSVLPSSVGPNTKKSKKNSHISSPNSLIKPKIACKQTGKVAGDQSSLATSVCQNKEMPNKSTDLNEPISFPSKRRPKETIQSDTSDNSTKQKASSIKVLEVDGIDVEVTDDGLYLKSATITPGDLESAGTSSISQPDCNSGKPLSESLHSGKPSNQFTVVTDKTALSSSSVSISKKVSVLDSSTAKYPSEVSLVDAKENSSHEHSASPIPSVVIVEEDESDVNVQKSKHFKAKNEKRKDSNSQSSLHSKSTPTVSGRKKSIPRKSVQNQSSSIGLKGSTPKNPKNNSSKISKELEMEKSSNSKNLCTSGATSKEVIDNNAENSECLKKKPVAEKQLLDFATYKMQSSTKPLLSDYIRAVIEDNCSNDSDSKSETKRNSFEDRTDKILKFQEKSSVRRDSENLVNQPLTEKNNELGTSAISVQHTTNEGDGNSGFSSLIPGEGTESKEGKTKNILCAGEDYVPDTEKIQGDSEGQNVGVPRKRRRINLNNKAGEEAKSVESDSSVKEKKTSLGNSEIEEKLLLPDVQHSIPQVVNLPALHNPENTAKDSEIEKIFSTCDSEQEKCSAKEKNQDLPRKQRKGNLAAKTSEVAPSEAKDSIVKEVKTSHCDAKTDENVSFAGILHKMPQVIESPASHVAAKSKEKKRKTEQVSSETNDCTPASERTLSPAESSEAQPTKKQRKMSCVTSIEQSEVQHSEGKEGKTLGHVDTSCSKDKIQSYSKTEENASLAEVVENWIRCMGSPPSAFPSSGKAECTQENVERNSNAAKKLIFTPEQKNSQASHDTKSSASTNLNVEDTANVPEVKAAEKNIESSTSNVARLKTNEVTNKTPKCIELELPSFAKEMYKRPDTGPHSQIAEVESKEILEKNKAIDVEPNAELESVQVLVEKSITRPVEDHDLCDKSARGDKSNVKTVPNNKTEDISVLQETNIESSENLNSRKSMDGKDAEKKEDSSVKGKASTSIPQVVHEIVSEDRVEKGIDHSEQPLSESVIKDDSAVQNKQVSENAEDSEFSLGTKKSKENSKSNSQPHNDSHETKKVRKSSKKNKNSIDKNVCMADAEGSSSTKDETSKGEFQKKCQNEKGVKHSVLDVSISKVEIIEGPGTKLEATDEAAKENSPAICDASPVGEAQTTGKQRDEKRPAASGVASESSVKTPKVCGTEAKEKFLKWNRDQDKEILLMCNKKGSDEETFEVMAKTPLFHPRTAAEIKSRFQQLLNIYRKALLSGALKKSQN